MILAVFAVLVVLFVVLPLIGWAVWLLVSTIVVGLIMGLLGRLIVPGAQRIGFLATLGCGVIGAIAGGAIGRGVGLGRFATVLIEIGVSAGVVAVWDLVAPRKRVGGGRTRAIGPRTGF